MITKKLKILFLIQLPPPVHGVSQINKQITESQALNKTFITRILEIKFSKVFTEIRTYPISKILKAITLSIKLFFNLASYKPDIVYFSMMPIGIGFIRDSFYLSIIKIFRPKIIIHFHNKGIARVRSKIIKYLYRTLFQNTNIIHLSKRLIKEELEPLCIRKSVFHELPNGINDEYTPEKSKEKSTLIKLLFLSNLLPDKGIFILLEMFKDLIEKYSNIHLSIVGAPTSAFDRKYKEFLYKYSKIADSITYHGELHGTAKRKILHNSDIFVFPSYFKEECMPLAIIEAIQFELPVVAFDIGVIDEQITHNHNGLLVKPNDVSTFMKYLERLISEPILRKEMGERGRLHYLNNFTETIFEERLMKIVNKVV